MDKLPTADVTVIDWPTSEPLLIQHFGWRRLELQPTDDPWHRMADRALMRDVSDWLRALAAL